MTTQYHRWLFLGGAFLAAQVLAWPTAWADEPGAPQHFRSLAYGGAARSAVSRMRTDGRWMALIAKVGPDRYHAITQRAFARFNGAGRAVIARHLSLRAVPKAKDKPRHEVDWGAARLIAALYFDGRALSRLFIPAQTALAAVKLGYAEPPEKVNLVHALDDSTLNQWVGQPADILGSALELLAPLNETQIGHALAEVDSYLSDGGGVFAGYRSPNSMMWDWLGKRLDGLREHNDPLFGWHYDYDRRAAPFSTAGGTKDWTPHRPLTYVLRGVDLRQFDAAYHTLMRRVDGVAVDRTEHLLRHRGRVKLSSAGLALPVRSAAHWVVDGSVDAPHVGLRHLLAQTVGQARHDGYLRRPAARAGGMDTIGFGADASSDNRAIAKDLETLGGLEVAALWDCFEKVAARVKGGDAGGTASLERDLDQRMVHHLSRLAQAKHPALTTVLSGYGAQTF